MTHAAGPMSPVAENTNGVIDLCSTSTIRCWCSSSFYSHVFCTQRVGWTCNCSVRMGPQDVTVPLWCPCCQLGAFRCQHQMRDPGFPSVGLLWKYCPGASLLIVVEGERRDGKDSCSPVDSGSPVAHTATSVCHTR